MSSSLQYQIRSYFALILVVAVVPSSGVPTSDYIGKWFGLIYLCYSALAFVWANSDSALLKYRLTIRSKVYLFLLMPLTLSTYLLRSRSRRSKWSWFWLSATLLCVLIQLFNIFYYSLHGAGPI